MGILRCSPTLSRVARGGTGNWGKFEDSLADRVVAGEIHDSLRNVPEPGSVAVLGLGLASLMAARRRKAARR
jgi:hypothetical protein